MSICFDRVWCTGFLANANAPWLSILRIVEGRGVIPYCSSSNNWPIHLISFAASVNAIYSASIVEMATVGCLQLFHTTTASFNKTTTPVVDLRESKSLPQSASEYPTSFDQNPRGPDVAFCPL